VCVCVRVRARACEQDQSLFINLCNDWLISQASLAWSLTF